MNSSLDAFKNEIHLLKLNTTTLSTTLIVVFLMTSTNPFYNFYVKSSATVQKVLAWAIKNTDTKNFIQKRDLSGSMCFVIFTKDRRFCHPWSTSIQIVWYGELLWGCSWIKNYWQRKIAQRWLEMLLGTVVFRLCSHHSPLIVLDDPIRIDVDTFCPFDLSLVTLFSQWLVKDDYEGDETEEGALTNM